MSLFLVECCCSRFREGAVITFSRDNAGFRNDKGNPLVVTIGEIEANNCPYCGAAIMSQWVDAVVSEEDEDEAPVVS